MIDFDFSGRTVLVTGAATGMGFVEAQFLANAGAEVWMADIRAEVLADSAKNIPKTAGEIHQVQLDVTDPESWQKALADIEEKSGKLDGLVNNAGRSLRKSLLETTDAEWQSILGVNLDSVFYGMKYSNPLLLRGSKPSVVNVSSITGMLGYFAPAYGTSKWGVRGLSQSAALEFAAGGIRVNSIHPGLVNSPLLNSGTSEFVDESVRAIPMNRVAEPLEVARTVAFLLDESSSYITGTEIVIDGGLTSGGIYKQIIDRLTEN